MENAPRTTGPIGVYLPVGETTIARGSGIVGSTTSEWFLPALVHVAEESLTVDFEGNLYGAVNIVTFADRCRHAYDRHVRAYPTVARMTVDPATMRWIGEYHPEQGEVVLDAASWHVLAEWLGVETGRAVDLVDELRVS